MLRMENSKRRRLISGLLAVLMLSVMLFSALIIVHEADHDCIGEDCPICACIHQCENTLQQLGSGVTAQFAVVIPAIFIFLLAFLRMTELPQETLVSRKVRLDD